MDFETLYTIAGIGAFGAIVFFTLRDTEAAKVQTKEEKKYEILSAYKKELREALELLGDDNEARIAKKKELLQKFNQELSMNIFFDAMDAKDLLIELAEEK